MAFFPKLGPEFLNDRDYSIRNRIESFYADNISMNEFYWQEADTDTRYEAGDQTLWNDIYGNGPITNSKKFNFNRIRRIINMISGFQRRNRKSIIVSPIENSDQMTADQFSKIIMWSNQREGVLDTISEAFNSALITGMSFLHVWIDYRSDPVSGNIRVDNRSYNSVLIDPFFKKADLSDCNGIFMRSYLTKSGCMSLLPDKADEIADLSGRGTQDGKFQYMPESFNYDTTNLLTYDEFYYRDYRTQKMLVDTQTGATMEWPPESTEKALKEYLGLFPQISVIEQEIPTVKLAILVQGKVMYDGPNPMGIDVYPIVPVMAYFSPQLPSYEWRVQGVVRGLRDAQYLYNRRKTIELDILESQINSGWKYKENALINPKDIFLSGQGRGLALKEEAQMSDVEKIMPAQVPPSMMQLSQLLGQEIQEISGVNEELLGSAVDDKAGILSMLRQGAGLTTLQRLFDQLDSAQRLLGRIFIKLIQNNFVPAKVERLINETPSAEFYNKAFGEYDAVIEEGFYTSTQRQVQFAQLLHLRESGIPVPDDVLINAATLQNKEDLIKAIDEKKQQEEQQQQAQQQLQMQQQAAETRLVNARATADEGLGAERYSRIDENQALAVERYAEAEKDKDIALLNVIKALKEVESIDLQNVEKMLALEKIMREKDTRASQPVTSSIPPNVLPQQSPPSVAPNVPAGKNSDISSLLQGLS